MIPLIVLPSALFNGSLAHGALVVGALAGAPHAVDTPNSSAADSAESVVKRYDLAAYARPYRRDGQRYPLLAGSLPAPYQDEGVDDAWTVDPGMIRDAVIELLAEEFEYQDRQFWNNDDDELIIRAPEALHAQVARLLEPFARGAATTSGLQIDVVALDGSGLEYATHSGLLDLAQAEALLANAGGKRSSFRVPLHAGRVSSVDASTVHPILGDYYVEVAEGVHAYDPVRVKVLTGTRIEAAAAPIPGGCQLALVLLHGESDGPREESRMRLGGHMGSDSAVVQADGPERLQILDVAQRSFALNTAIPDGKALILRSSFDLAKASDSQLVVVRRGGPLPEVVQSASTKGGGGELHLMRVDSFEAPRVQLMGPLVDNPRRVDVLGQGGYFEWGPLHGGIQVFEAMGARDVLEDRFHFLNVRHEGVWTLITMDPEQHAEGEVPAKLGAEVRAAAAALAETSEVVTIDLRLTRSGEGASKGLACSMPLRVGVSSAVVLGVEAGQLVDYDVEIAKSSSVCDPIVRVALDGLALVLTPRRTADGALSLHLAGGASLAREIGSFDPRSAGFGVMEEEVHDRLRLDETVSLGRAAASFALGDIAADGDGLRLEVSVR